MLVTFTARHKDWENSILQDAIPPDRSLTQYAQGLRNHLKANLTEAREHLDIARMEQRRQYNKGSRPMEFTVDGKVLRRLHPLSDAAKGFAASLTERWDGPYEVTKHLSSSIAYELRNLAGGRKTGPVNISELTAYLQR